MNKIVLLAEEKKMQDPKFADAIRMIPKDTDLKLACFADESHLADQLRSFCEADFERALVCGGDGTLHQVVDQIMKLKPDERIAIGVVPMGTANDFAKTAGFAKEGLPSAVRNAVRAPIRDVDVGWVNGRAFINGVSAGAVARTTTDVPHVLKSVFGRFAYYLNALSRVASIETHQLVFRGKAQGETWEFSERCFAFAVGNSSSLGGGFKIAPEAKINDGVLDLLVIKEQSLVELVSLATELLKEEPDLRNHQVRYIRSCGFEVEAVTDLQINLDGEPMRGRKFKFSISPKALRLAANTEMLN